MKIAYKGVEIRPSSYLLDESKGWDTGALIRRYTENGLEELRIADDAIYQNKAEAEQHAVAYAKQYIDEKYLAGLFERIWPNN